jgi:DNA helicase-2/ATP-dependent DNA helicase PcrA
MKSNTNLLSSLNPAQAQAVTHSDGPLLIVAGAGTGKTTVLIKRLAYLIQEKNISPEQILITTFTEKGAGELEERADTLLPYGYVNLWINTFHGFGERILRDHALDIGLSPAFKILTQTEQWILIKKNLEIFTLDYYRPLGDPTKFIHELISHFSRLKDENISPARYLEYVETLKTRAESTIPSKDTSSSASKPVEDKKKKKSSKKIAKDMLPETPSDELDLARLTELSNAYHTYNKLLLDNGLMDFGDLITYTIKLFQERPNILEKYRQQFKYIMVDEFQDTNSSQYELIKLLAAPDNNLVAVGDDDQSIYRFRGASLSNIMQFKDDFPSAKEIVLTENYRSGQEILDTAYTFIKHNNPNRLEEKLKINKHLIASGKSKSAEIRSLEFASEFTETQAVVEMIQALHQSKQAENWADIAILVRANSAADTFTRELTRHNIPNHFVSLKGLYYKPVILDCIAYFKLLDNYHEPSALFRVLNMACFKMSHSDLLILNKWARRKLWSLFKTLEKIELVTEVSPEGKLAAKKLLKNVQAHALLTKDTKASKVYVTFVRDCLLPFFDEDNNHEVYNFLNQFYSKIKNFETADNSGTLKDFLDLINLEMEAGETGGLRFNFDDADTVKIMTIHAAKGLEFGHVFITNLVDKKFPTIHRSEHIYIPEELGGPRNVSKDSHLEEERRLMYVALTRGKRGVYCTGAKDYGGVREKKPSRFIAEAGLTIETINRQDMTELERDLAHLDTVAPSFNYQLPQKFSFSQLTTFERCPLDYKYIYILKIPLEDNPQAVFGRCLHSCLRQFLLPLLENTFQPALFGEKKVDDSMLSLTQLMKYYDKFWNDSGYQSRQQADDFKIEGKKMLADFQTSLPETKPKVVFLEKKFNLSLGQYQLNGTVDRVDKLPDGTYEIIDYKSGKKPKTISFEQKRQLLLYQAALEENFQLKISKLTFHYLKNNETFSFVAKPADIEKVKQKLITLIEEIKVSDFTPLASSDCKYCQHGPIAK